MEHVLSTFYPPTTTELPKPHSNFISLPSRRTREAASPNVSESMMRRRPAGTASGITFLALLACTFALLLPSALAEGEGNGGAERPGDGSSDDGSRRGGSGGGIRWHNLSVSLRRRSKWGRAGGDRRPGERTVLLHRSSNFVENGHVCGILGPSGAGKSTLLAALSGTTLKAGGLVVTGSVWVDADGEGDVDDAAGTGGGIKSYLSTSDGEVAFLHQQDSFFSMLTPRETLDLAAYLQLAGCDDAERRRVVDQTLDSLGLSGVAERCVGDRTLGGQDSGGLSGGERRRLSLAVELITSPKVFFADEPTTGLDSAQAEKVVNLIVKLARERNIPAICSLHQPRTSIWKSLDSFILLAPGGKVCYMGKREDATAYFSKLGYECPPETNPAEFFIDLVSIDTEDPDEASIDEARIEHLSRAFAEETGRHTSNSGEIWIPPEERKSMFRTGGTVMVGLGRRNVFQRFAVLLLRSWRQNMRNYKLNLVRLAGSVGQALMFSELFSSVKCGKSITKSIADRVALLSFGVINMCMLAVMKTLDLFGREKVVVTRERMRNQYSSFEYLLSKALAEIPIDACFGGAFAAVLKSRTGLRTSLSVLTWTFSMLTVAGASLGFVVGSVTPNVEAAMATGVPIMVILMAVGIINPSGVDVNDPPPALISWLKLASPIKLAIEALCVAEFRDMEFGENDRQRWRALKDLPRMGGLALVQNGNQVLDALGLSHLTYEGVMEKLASLAGISLLLSWCGLAFCGPSFVESTEKVTDVKNASNKPSNESELADDASCRGEICSKKAGSVEEVPLVRAIN